MTYMQVQSCAFNSPVQCLVKHVLLLLTSTLFFCIQGKSECISKYGLVFSLLNICTASEPGMFDLHEQWLVIVHITQMTSALRAGIEQNVQTLDFPV